MVLLLALCMVLLLPFCMVRLVTHCMALLFIFCMALLVMYHMVHVICMLYGSVISCMTLFLTVHSVRYCFLHIRVVVLSQLDSNFISCSYKMKVSGILRGSVETKVSLEMVSKQII